MRTNLLLGGLGRSRTAAALQAETLAYEAAIVANGGTLPSPHKAAVDTFVLTLKANSIWTKLNWIWPCLGGEMAGALVSLKGLSGSNPKLAKAGTVADGAYSPNAGITLGSANGLFSGEYIPDPPADGSVQAYGNTSLGAYWQRNYSAVSGAGADNHVMCGALVNGFGFAVTLQDGSIGYGDKSGLLMACNTTGSGSVCYQQLALNGRQNHSYGGPNLASSNCTGGVISGAFVGNSLTDPEALILAAAWDALAAATSRQETVVSTSLDGCIMTGQSLAIGGNPGDYGLATIVPVPGTYTLSAPLTTPESGSLSGRLSRQLFGQTADRIIKHAAAGNRDPSGSFFDVVLESPIDGFANSLATFRGSTKGTLSALAAHGGGALSTIEQGTDYYTWGTNAVRDMVALCPVTFNGIRAVLMVHGESDDNSLTQSQYASGLATYLSHLRTDYKALTGQSYDFPLLISQHVSWKTNKTSTTAPAMYDAHIAAAGIVLVCSKYIFPHADGTHLHYSTSYQWLGEYYAKAYNIIETGGTLEPLRPLSVVRSGTNVTAVFTKGGLTIDTTIVSDNSATLASKIGSTDVNVVSYKGFEFVDGNGSSPPTANINGHSITTTNIANDTVVFTLDATPTGSNKRLRAAYTAPGGAGGGPTTGPRTNLRDADASYTSAYGNTLYNWCVTFDVPMT